MNYFTHLHVHSHFSILDGMSKVPDLVSKCKKNGMYAMALTDHGNMYGIKELVDCVNKENGKLKDKIKEQEAVLNNDGADPKEKEEAAYKLEQLKGQHFKAIIGTEAYCAHRTLYDKDGTLKEADPETGKERIVDRSGYHLILLAKNKQGYKSLCKLCSIAYTDGYYFSPRIDKKVLEQYHEGLIVCSACLGGEIPQLIMHGDLEAAEASVLWFKNLFGDDYYIELQRHQTNKPNSATDTYERQQKVNEVLIQLARKHNIKIIATNDVHFVEEEHGEAHDRLICLSTGKDFDDPTRMHYTKQEWLKSPDEMAAIFADLPEALENTREIVDKVEEYSIDSDPIMPMFPIPETFGTEEEYRARITEQELFDEFTRNDKGEVVLSQSDAEKKIKKLGGYNKLYRIKFEADYLSKLVWEGAHKRYGEELTEEQIERITFELHTIKTMGFPGYFLIVQDYIRGAREELGVSVGPGRGSAAGSVVAYCLWITDIDPLKYDLLFERFLNPDRISLPDIDVDFDDAGRGKVLDWITKKYGKEKVAHIITYGTMASKSAIADVSRIQRIPLNVVADLKSLIPEKSFPDNIKDEKGKSPKVNLKNCYKYVPELAQIMSNDEGKNKEIKEMLTYAEELEDTNRQVGIHACGVIIGADDLTKFAPVCTIKDKATGEDVLVTQYDGHVVESVGLIKMDFLGLKNLSIIKDALQTIKRRSGEVVDIDTIPIDDELTYQLFCEGNTVGTFQFESAGMQKYLRELQPHVFEDLIAMNALYRPGPMDYIPDFIDRKLGRKPVEYDIPCMEKYLKDTYGITVYQEQVMLLSRQLAGFTRGQSDTLRKAMGKKQIEKMNELEVLFYQGGEANGHDHATLNKIWEDWKKFASYAFNKSHATCYSWVAYQTAYLKAHYPAEYMAAVMTSSLSDITRVTELMEDCKKNHIDILLPSVNESDLNFSVNKEGKIRFGLAAIKGMGEAAATVIINERDANGPYTDIFDFLKRIDVHSINRKNLEVLAKSGAFDEFTEMHRAQYFYKEGNADNAPIYIERLLRWAARCQENDNSSQMTLFDMCDEIKMEDHPPIPQIEPWSSIERCNEEREVIGFYISGHPLDHFKLEFTTFVNTKLIDLENLDALINREIAVAGIVTEANKGLSKKTGKPYGKMIVGDFSGTHTFFFNSKECDTFGNFLEAGRFIIIRGIVSHYQNKNAGPDNQPEYSRPFFKISNISDLASILDEKAKSISFHVNLDQVTNEFCDKLLKIAKAHKGKTRMSIVVHGKNNMSLYMTARENMITPKSFITALKNEMPQIYNIKVIV